MPSAPRYMKKCPKTLAVFVVGIAYRSAERVGIGNQPPVRVIGIGAVARGVPHGDKVSVRAVGIEHIRLTGTVALRLLKLLFS